MRRLVKSIAAGTLMVATFVFVPNAYAGKVELTTYYPAPYGEYKSLTASKSFIPPKMTTVERDAITPPLTAGMVIFNTDTARLEIYDGTYWQAAGGGVPTLPSASAPTCTTNTLGSQYYDTTTNTVQTCYNTGWQTLGGGGHVYSAAAAWPLFEVASSSWIDVDGMLLGNKSFSGGNVAILFVVPRIRLTSLQSISFQILLDGTPVGYSTCQGTEVSYVLPVTANIPAGTHSIKVQARNNPSYPTALAGGGNGPRMLVAIESQ